MVMGAKMRLAKLFKKSDKNKNATLLDLENNNTVLLEMTERKTKELLNESNNILLNSIYILFNGDNAEIERDNDYSSCYGFRCYSVNKYYQLYCGKKAGGYLLRDMIEAKFSVKIISPYILTCQDNSLNYLLKHNQGAVDFCVITDKIVNEYLKEDARLRIKQYEGSELLHQKIYIIDEDKVYIGSMNFTYSGINENLETLIRISQPQMVCEFVKYFNELFFKK